MRLRSKIKSRRHRQRQGRRPICRRFMLKCHLPCVRHYAESDAGSDIQRDSLLDGDGQPSVVGASWEEPEDAVVEPAMRFWENPDPDLFPNESTDDPDPAPSASSLPGNFLMVEEMTSPTSDDVTGAAGSSISNNVCPDSPDPSETSSQLSDVRFNFSSRFHMGSSPQYRLWKDVFGQHRHQTLPRRSNSESENSQTEELCEEEQYHARNTETSITGTGRADTDVPTDPPEQLSAAGGCDQLFRGARSLPTLPQSGPESDEDFSQPGPSCVLADHRHSFERNWDNLMVTSQDDVFAVCTNPALSGSYETTLSSQGSLGHSAGRPTRSSSLNDLDTLLDDFSLGTGSHRNSLGRQYGQSINVDATRDTFCQLFAVSNRLAGLTRPIENRERTSGEGVREPVHLTSLFIDPNPSATENHSIQNAQDVAANSTRSNSQPGSVQSNSMERRNVQQSWYVYDPRLLPGGIGGNQSRLTVETNYRGVQQSWSMPGIISPPSYDEVTSFPATGLPPPYQTPTSTLSSIGPPSESEDFPPIPVDPPPPYEPHSTELDDIADCLDISPEEDEPQIDADMLNSTESEANDISVSEVEEGGSVGRLGEESEAAINEELDSILEEETTSVPGSIGDITENSHGFFMNSDTGNSRISSFGAAIMSGVGFGAARPPVRWNRGMGLDRWASTSNWVSS